MRRAMQRKREWAVSATRVLPILSLIAMLVACGEAHIVHQDRYPPARETARHPVAGRGEYVVVHGDTLYGIAFRNGMDFRELAAINGIEPPYTIYVDQLLRLRGERMRPMPRQPAIATAPVATKSPAPNPPATRPATASGVHAEALPESPHPASRPPSPAGVASQPPSAPPKPAPAAPAVVSPGAPSAASIPTDSAPIGSPGWRWPAKGALIDRFMAGDATRQGIDIAGDAGDPVLAAADGVVVYSGSGLVGYGELIIIKHSDEWLSAYGHNRKRLVAEGQRVKGGQQIAEMGRTGASRDELHFEIRRNGRPVDPQQYLPPR
jgi:lipoprotein NlpD